MDQAAASAARKVASVSLLGTAKFCTNTLNLITHRRQSTLPWRSKREKCPNARHNRGTCRPMITLPGFKYYVPSNARDYHLHNNQIS